jgi:hypothetical protein
VKKNLIHETFQVISKKIIWNITRRTTQIRPTVPFIVYSSWFCSPEFLTLKESPWREDWFLLVFLIFGTFWRTFADIIERVWIRNWGVKTFECRHMWVSDWTFSTQHLTALRKSTRVERRPSPLCSLPANTYFWLARLLPLSSNGISFRTFDSKTSTFGSVRTANQSRVEGGSQLAASWPRPPTYR